MTTKSASTSVVRGASLMMLVKFAERSIGFVSTLILARVLTPADFGLVAMAMTVVALMELMGAFGFDVAIIQHPDAQRKHYDTAWTLNLLLGIATAAMLLAIAYPAALFYHEPRLRLILMALALGALLQGLENIGTVNFRKNMEFGREFRFLLVKRLGSFTVTVTLALIFRTYWALIAGIVFGRLFSVAMSYLLHPFRPKWSLEAGREFFHFSKWLFLSNVVVFIQNKSDSFILGRTVGAYDLGLYTVASEIAVMPSTELIAPINRAVFPMYSRMSKDLSALREKFLEVFGNIALLVVPISVGLVCVAEQAVEVLLGHQWASATPLLRIFAVCGLTSAVQSNLILIITAIGQPKTNTVLSAAMLVLYLPLLVYGSIRFGVFGAAWVHLIMSIIVLIPLHVVFFRILVLAPGAYFRQVWRPVCAAALMAFAIFGVKAAFGGTLLALPALIILMILVGVGAVVFAGATMLFWVCSGSPGNSAEAALLRMLFGGRGPVAPKPQST